MNHQRLTLWGKIVRVMTSNHALSVISAVLDTVCSSASRVFFDLSRCSMFVLWADGDISTLRVNVGSSHRNHFFLQARYQSSSRMENQQQQRCQRNPSVASNQQVCGERMGINHGADGKCGGEYCSCESGDGSESEPPDWQQFQQHSFARMAWQLSLDAGRTCAPCQYWSGHCEWMGRLGHETWLIQSEKAATERIRGYQRPFEMDDSSAASRIHWLGQVKILHSNKKYIRWLFPLLISVKESDKIFFPGMLELLIKVEDGDDT